MTQKLIVKTFANSLAVIYAFKTMILITQSSTV